MQVWFITECQLSEYILLELVKMVDRHKLKITVLRRFSPPEVFETLPVTPSSTLEACGIYEDGQEIIVEENLRMPEGFCQSAWQSIYCTIRTLGAGGNLPWYKEEGVAISCCTDGLRPVVFKIERI